MLPIELAARGRWRRWVLLLRYKNPRPLRGGGASVKKKVRRLLVPSGETDGAGGHGRRLGLPLSEDDRRTGQLQGAWSDAVAVPRRGKRRLVKEAHGKERQGRCNGTARRARPILIHGQRKGRRFRSRQKQRQSPVLCGV
jgi:hypothetical protein